MTLGSPYNSLKVCGDEKCTLASQELLESSSNQEYYNPEWPPKVLWNSARNLGPQIDLKLSTWHRFVRIQQNIEGTP